VSIEDTAEYFREVAYLEAVTFFIMEQEKMSYSEASTYYRTFLQRRTTIAFDVTTVAKAIFTTVPGGNVRFYR